MGRACKLNSNNKSISLAKDVKDICQPIFKNLGLNGFSYSRVFPDGSRSELWSDPDALFHTFLNKKYIADTYTPDNYGLNDKHLFLPNRIKIYSEPTRKRYEKQLADQKEIFNHDNCFIIVNKNNTLCEYFIFYTPSDFCDPVNFYLNKFDRLEAFSKQFRSKSHKLIELVDKDRIIRPWRSKVVSKSFNNQQLKEHKKCDTKINFINLTKRELQVAQHIVCGKTAKESAELLGISARTVETYIENIKDKYGCSRKNDLIIKLLKMNFFNMGLK